MNERSRAKVDGIAPPEENVDSATSADDEVAPRCCLDGDVVRRVNLALWWAFSNKEREG